MIDQVAIFVFGIAAVWLSQDPRPKWTRFACVFGLASQPFWFYTTATHHQWGIFASAFLYTYAWVRGFYHHWVK
jgi:hypothetical protein